MTRRIGDERLNCYNPVMTERKFTLIEKLRRNRLSHRQRSKIFRFLVILAGMLLVLAGLIMLVTPGPAFVVLPAGLYLLALEFDWAERLLEKVLKRAEQAQDNSFVKSTVHFIKKYPKISAALFAILVTIVVAVVILIVSPETITNRV
ncbi:hypothetical protein EXS54_01950 [Patescibacteria group bacterium]|nr:hypothetical protein [Patescibacteria group bacterium]